MDLFLLSNQYIIAIKKISNKTIILIKVNKLNLKLYITLTIIVTFLTENDE